MDKLNGDSFQEDIRLLPRTKTDKVLKDRFCSNLITTRPKPAKYYQRQTCYGQAAPKNGGSYFRMSGSVNLLNCNKLRTHTVRELENICELPCPVVFCVHHTSDDKAPGISCRRQSDPINSKHTRLNKSSISFTSTYRLKYLYQYIYLPFSIARQSMFYSIGIQRSSLDIHWSSA